VDKNAPLLNFTNENLAKQFWLGCQLKLTYDSGNRDYLAEETILDQTLVAWATAQG